MSRTITQHCERAACMRSLWQSINYLLLFLLALGWCFVLEAAESKPAKNSSLAFFVARVAADTQRRAKARRTGAYPYVDGIPRKSGNVGLPGCPRNTHGRSS